MGADLYLKSEYEDNFNTFKPEFDRWVIIRDKAKTKEEKKEAQKRVEEYYNKMYEKGHFRDPYNVWSIFWQLRLSWWKDVGELLENGILTPENAKVLWLRIEENEGLFLDRLFMYKKKYANSFVKDLNELKGFLKKAIEKNESIECSI